MNFDRLNEVELQEFLKLNGVYTDSLHKDLVQTAHKLYTENKQVQITVPVMALHRAKMVPHIPGYYETTAYKFLERDVDKDLTVQAKALSIDPSVPYLRLFIFRVLQLQGKVREQTSDEIQQARLFDYVSKLIEQNNIAGMQQLFIQGLDANLKDDKGVSLLWYATVGIPGKPYRIDMIRLLLDKGADVNFMVYESSVMKNVSYAKPAETDRMKLLQDLFEKYNVNPGVTEPENALFAAIISQNLIIIEYLLQKGLSTSVSNNYRTIFEVDIYDFEFNLKLYPLLLKYGADKTLPNASGESIVYVIANTYNKYLGQNNTQMATRFYELYQLLN